MDLTTLVKLPIYFIMHSDVFDVLRFFQVILIILIGAFVIPGSILLQN